MTRFAGTYTDEKGNKVVEPVFHGNGTVGGFVAVKR